MFLGQHAARRRDGARARIRILAAQVILGDVDPVDSARGRRPEDVVDAPLPRHGRDASMRMGELRAGKGRMGPVHAVRVLVHEFQQELPSVLGDGAVGPDAEQRHAPMVFGVDGGNAVAARRGGLGVWDAEEGLLVFQSRGAVRALDGTRRCGPEQMLDVSGRRRRGIVGGGAGGTRQVAGRHHQARRIISLVLGRQVIGRPFRGGGFVRRTLHAAAGADPPDLHLRLGDRERGDGGGERGGSRFRERVLFPPDGAFDQVGALDGSLGSDPPHLHVVVGPADAGDSPFDGGAPGAGDLVTAAGFVADPTSPLDGAVGGHEEEIEQVPFFLITPGHRRGALARGFGGDLERGLPVVDAALVPRHRLCAKFR